MSINATQTTLAGADAVAGATIVASWLGWLPQAAAIIAIIWYAIQIWESKTVQALFARRRSRHK